MKNGMHVRKPANQVRVPAGSAEAWLSWWPRVAGLPIDPHHPAATLSLPLETVTPHP